MLTRSSRSAVRRTLGQTVAFLAVTATVLTSGCDKVPLLAPTGSVITIFPTTSTVPLNGSVEIVATVIENGVATAAPSTPPTTPTTPTTPGQTPTTPTTPTTPSATATTGAGTPVQNGTVVTFTTTIGRVEPSEARTNNGQVRVRFIAGEQSGTATITAFSGGASAKLENLRVGTAAAERLVVTATPQVVSCSGGTTEIQARVEDTAGAGLGGVPVSFSTTQGTVAPPTSTTDSNGVARSQLTTTREATVTASVAGKTQTVLVTVNARTGLGISATGSAGGGTGGGTGGGAANTFTAGVPTLFTVTLGENAGVNDLRVDFGDGTSQSLGAINQTSTTIFHTYQESGTYIVRASAQSSTGCSEQVSTSVAILPAQPPSITVSVSNQNPAVGETVIVTANVSNATSTIIRYEWNFGSGAVPATATTTGNQVTTTYTTTGTKIITVRVIQSSGPSGDTQTAVVVSQ